MTANLMASSSTSASASTPASPWAEEPVVTPASPLDKPSRAEDDTDTSSGRSGMSVTAYLRSAMMWGSTRQTAPAPTPERDQETQDKAGEDLLESPPLAMLSDEAEVEPEEENPETKHYDVKYYCLPDIDPVEEGETSSMAFDSERGPVSELFHRPLQYVDVLLQADAHGLGLNVGVRKSNESRHGGFDCILVVQSFRRLHPDDVGPAEASEKIRVGDIVHAVDGEQVRSLQQLQAKMAARTSRRKFVLLRFLRPGSLLKGSLDAASGVAFDSGNLEAELPADDSKTNRLGLESLLLQNPEAATVIRDLATTNRVLQDQLMASKLKQEEQRIQLDQLHALYARTQTENVPLFSFPKSIRPFSRRSGTPNSDDSSTEASLPSRIQMEVTEAIEAEYARLSQQFKLQLQLDKRELESRYSDQAKQLREATDKKLEMLEAGFKQALQHYADGHQCCCQCNVACAARRQRVKDPKRSARTDDTQLDHHSMPSRSRASEIGSVSGGGHHAISNTSAQEKLQWITAVLEQYEKIRYTRKEKLKLQSDKSWTSDEKNDTSASLESK